MNNKQQQFVIDNYNIMLTNDISRVINVSKDEIIDYIIKSSLDKQMRKTSKISSFDGEYIKKNYLTQTSAEISKVIGVTDKQVRGWIQNHIKGDRVPKHRNFNTNFFRDIDTYEKAYYLGLIYADGWIYRSDSYDKAGIRHTTYEFGIELQSKDKYILEGLSAALGGAHDVATYSKSLVICNNKNESHSTMSKLRIYSKDIVMDLNKNGIDFKKTYSGKFPVVDRKYFLAFLKGYIDGDGCIHKMKNNILGVHITSCCRGVLDYVNEAVYDLLGFHTSIYNECDKKHRIYWFDQTKVKSLLDSIYSINTPEIKRKRSVYEEFYGLSVR